MTPSSPPLPWGVPRLVPVAELRFDRRSPRLAEVPDAYSEEQVLERLWRESALDGLVASIAASGFFPDEPLIVQSHGADLVVVDGNRRLAAVRMLTDRALRERLQVADLPTAHAPSLQQLPALVSPRDAVWQALGYRHVSGPQPWRSYARAGYIAWVHEELGVTLDQVARGLGDTEAAVLSLYRALRALRAAEGGEVFHVDDRWTSHLPFSLLVAALERPGIREFAGEAPSVRLAELGDLCTWLFGRRSKDLPPAVRAADPDLDMLEQVVGHQGALAAMRSGQPLEVAYELSRDRRGRLRDSVIAARHLLQEAQGALPVRTPEQADLLRAVDDLMILVQTLRHGLLTDP